MSEIVKYDDASWHSGGDFPKDLPAEAGATHIGMYLAWAVSHQLASAELDDQELLLNRKITPGQFLMETCDGKLLTEDLNDEGNRFSSWYYSEEDNFFYQDLDMECREQSCATVYHLPDTWEVFDKLSKRIDASFIKFESPE